MTALIFHSINKGGNQMKNNTLSKIMLYVLADVIGGVLGYVIGNKLFNHVHKEGDIIDV